MKKLEILKRIIVDDGLAISFQTMAQYRTMLIQLIDNLLVNKTAIDLFEEERQRQIDVEGWTPEHDAKHDTGYLACAAAAYACAEIYRRTTKEGFDNMPAMWPFEREWWKPTPENRIRELQKAGALIAAEIDRLKSNRKIDNK